MLVRLQAAKLADPHALGPADPRQVVSQQVDDHDVLGPVLLAVAKFDLGRRSACGSPVRGRVPLIGRVSTRPAATRRIARATR